MSKTEKSTIKTEAVFDDTGQHRFTLRKEWNKTKQAAMIIMISPSTANQLKIDPTTMYIMNNLTKLDYGSVEIVNLYSKINIKTNHSEDNLNHEENDQYIVRASAKADTIIIGWGKTGSKNKRLQQRKTEVLKLLEKQKEKIHIIMNGNGEGGFHPLAPQIRFAWQLKPCSPENLI